MLCPSGFTAWRTAQQRAATRRWQPLQQTVDYAEAEGVEVEESVLSGAGPGQVAGAWLGVLADLQPHFERGWGGAADAYGDAIAGWIVDGRVAGAVGEEAAEAAAGPGGLAAAVAPQAAAPGSLAAAAAAAAAAADDQYAGLADEELAAECKRWVHCACWLAAGGWLGTRHCACQAHLVCPPTEAHALLCVCVRT